MKQYKEASSTAPQDAFEHERLENVHPAGWRNPRPADRYSLVVVGAGTAGLVAAHAAAALGAKVALIERHLLGGDCLNGGTDALTVDGAKLRFRKALIATGSRPNMPSIPGLIEAGYLTNENIFDQTELPRRLLVIGGGPLGCELAQAFCRFGAKTIIAQSRPLFLPGEERDAAQLLSDAFARDGIEVRLNTRPVNVRVENGEKLVDLVSDDFKSTVAVDAILTGTGRLPNVEDLNLKAAGVEFEKDAGSGTSP